jgi:hypothetical protein
MAATNFSGPVISAAGFQSPVGLAGATGVPATAGGSTTPALSIGNVAGLGIYFGTGAPTISASKGSFYLNTTATTNVTRAYINTDGLATWTAVNTVA